MGHGHLMYSGELLVLTIFSHTGLRWKMLFLECTKQYFFQLSTPQC